MPELPSTPELPEVDIKSCEQVDLPSLEQQLPAKGYHQKRFNEQQAGQGTYMVAWQDNKPIGHLNLSWSVLGRPRKTPFINGMAVIPELRSQGIGTKLLNNAIKTAVEKGFKRIGLMVGVTNIPAKKLYERLGFKDWDGGTEVTKWPEIADDPNSRMVEEECFYLVKDL